MDEKITEALKNIAEALKNIAEALKNIAEACNVALEVFTEMLDTFGEYKEELEFKYFEREPIPKTPYSFRGKSRVYDKRPHNQHHIRNNCRKESWGIC